MHKILLAAVLLATFTTSCSKEQRIIRKENKLIGVWEFEKVFYKKEGALFRDNITHEYRDDIVEFFPDYSAIYDDYSLGVVFEGIWSIYLDEDHIGDQSDLEFFVDAVFYDFFSNEDFFLFGSIDRLNRNKLNLEAHDRRGKYTFKLRRL